MIFLTVGSELPFDRLVRTIDEWCVDRGRQDVFGQIAEPGTGGYRPTNFEWRPFLSTHDYDQHCRDADLIVGHAGMGSIITAMTYMKPIVIMPRKAAFKETRNDHQIATAEWLGERNGVLVAQDEVVLRAVLDRASEHGTARTLESPLEPYAEPRLLATIRDYLLSS